MGVALLIYSDDLQRRFKVIIATTFNGAKHACARLQLDDD